MSNCVDCSKFNLDNIDRVCRVCELVDRDYTTKKVSYCSFCDAYICEGCTTNVYKRGKAAVFNIKLKL